MCEKLSYFLHKSFYRLKVRISVNGERKCITDWRGRKFPIKIFFESFPKKLKLRVYHNYCGVGGFLNIHEMLLCTSGEFYQSFVLFCCRLQATEANHLYSCTHPKKINLVLFSFAYAQLFKRSLSEVYMKRIIRFSLHFSDQLRMR